MIASMKTTTLLLLLILSVAFAHAKDKKDASVTPAAPVVSEHDSDTIARLKAQIERDNAQIETLQTRAQPILADGRERQGKLDAIVNRIKQEWEADHPGFIANFNTLDGDSGGWIVAVKPEEKPKPNAPELQAPTPAVEEKKP